MIIEFLSDMFYQGGSYSAINTAKSAITTFMSLATGRSFDKEAVLFNKFLRGVFTMRPSLPRYGCTWDAQKVLGYLKSQSPPEAISFIALSRKLVMLLLLLSGQRGQSIHSLDTRNLEVSEAMLIIRFGDVLKTSRPGHHTQEIRLPAYPDQPGLCVVKTYAAYIKRTKQFRKRPGKLFISTMRPHGPVSRDTVTKWAKASLALAGIDLNVYGVHSTRAASSSLALNKGVSLQTILRTVGWARESTFRKFYQREVTRDCDFAQGVLE